jgi:predicted DNA-binding protein
VKKTSLYLDPELDERLAQRAAEEGLTKAEFIRRTLEAAVTRPKRPRPSIAVFSSNR